jgi:hypothetical protein
MNAAARAGTLAVNLKSERFRRMVQNTVGGSAMCDSVHGAVSRRAAIYFYYQSRASGPGGSEGTD